MNRSISKPQHSPEVVGTSSEAHLLSFNATLSEEELKRRTSRLVHELRNPLHGILGAASLLRHSDNRIERPDPDRLLQIIETSGKHLLALIREMTDIVHSPTGQLPVQSSSVDLRRLMRESLDMVEPMAASKGLLPRLEVAPTIPEAVSVDPMRIQQVLVNLVGNAIRFTDSGLVEVSVREEATPSSKTYPPRRRLRFDVRDTGVGMAESELSGLLTGLSGENDQIPAKFVRRSGSGLGLKVCQRILTAMGSGLNMSSVPGRGTRVWFALLT